MRRSDHLVAVPNVSEGRDPATIAALVDAVRAGGARVVDVHSDRWHNRTVLTCAAEPPALSGAMVALARAAKVIDLTRQQGVHPRFGVLDVCPFVIDGTPAGDVVEVARDAGRAIATEAEIPVYLYGDAALRPERRQLPDLRLGGLAEIMRRSTHEVPPDFGPHTIDPRVGVTCVGARGPLIAFNVWLRTDDDVARRIATRVRTALGAAGVRTLGLDIGHGLAQVSMNLTDPASAGVDDAFREVAAGAADEGAEVYATEIVGVPPERFLPDPDAEAARLLMEPGRSLESVLRA